MSRTNVESRCGALARRGGGADVGGVGEASAARPPALRHGLDPVVLSMLVVPSLVTTPAIVAGAIVAGATGNGAAAAVTIAVAGAVLAVAGTACATSRSESGRVALFAVCGVLCALGVLFAALSALVFDPVHLAWLAAAVTIPSAVMVAGSIVHRTALSMLGVLVVNVVWAVDLALLGLEGLRRVIVGG